MCSLFILAASPKTKSIPERQKIDQHPLSVPSTSAGFPVPSFSVPTFSAPQLSNSIQAPTFKVPASTPPSNQVSPLEYQPASLNLDLNYRGNYAEYSG